MLTAPVLVEARGRRGPRAAWTAAAGRRPASGATHAASDGTRIEPADFGWCWWVERDDELWVQVVARPGRSRPDGWAAAAARQIPGLSEP